MVVEEIRRLDWRPRPRIVINPDFELGSVLTVHTVADDLTRGGNVLLMDADVLYDERIMQALVADRTVNRVLLDRDFEAGDEPVKLCLRAGVPVELRKQVAPGLQYDTIGESVGFFRFDDPDVIESKTPGSKAGHKIKSHHNVGGLPEHMDFELVEPLRALFKDEVRALGRLAVLVAGYVDARGHLPHEEAVRDLLLERSAVFDVADITGAPWIEIDYLADVERAALQVLPMLREPVSPADSSSRSATAAIRSTAHDGPIV